ncbi:cytochrome C biogenesis protein [Halioglobus japonicus]|uniref:Cytochrome c-type biogenesis protein n=1 Tax=Halioglobus japonicus TaxID=930805 RepID=A0AAP8MFH1_9GAMM|nr:cytochrome c-type biogenesis protein [Halioglobus japonicus]AQA18816.1 cytochrome C biogenesis protein [Halioglobus japonicus]PLW86848.1 cytochrome c-type biogenesis protein CcmH [Halioglobus japonicus]GHD23740.1 cytochrome c-type biogenesis protein CcmH [Halioglobus japonicus]
MRFVIALLVFVSIAAQAVIETYEFSDPALEERYRQLSAELRCPKCQNQNIADSNAPISQDLRRLLYEQLEAGASDEEILEYMVARYGEFVRYRPSYDGATLILWLAPLGLLVLALVGVVATLRGRRSMSEEALLDPGQQQRLDELLEQAGQDK